MDINQLSIVNDLNPEVNLITADHLANQVPRTLLHGAMSDGQLKHVYLGDDGLIHQVTYWELGTPTESGAMYLQTTHCSGPSGGAYCNEDYLSNKRAFPESCDFEFMCLLRRADVDIEFGALSPDADTGRKSRRTKLGCSPLFSGFIAEDCGLQLENINESIQAFVGLRSFESAYTLAVRLLEEACIQAEARQSDFYVEQTKRDQVLSIASAISASKEFKECPAYFLPYPEMFTVVYGRTKALTLSPESLGNKGGHHRVLVRNTPADFAPTQAIKRYGPKNPTARYPQALVGHINGKMFSAVKHEASEPTFFHVAQFGDTTRILKDLGEIEGLAI